MGKAFVYLPCVWCYGNINTLERQSKMGSVETGMDAVLSFYLGSGASATRRNIRSRGRWVFLFFGPWCPTQGYYMKVVRTMTCVVWTAIKSGNHLPMESGLKAVFSISWTWRSALTWTVKSHGSPSMALLDLIRVRYLLLHLSCYVYRIWTMKSATNLSFTCPVLFCLILLWLVSRCAEVLLLSVLLFTR